MKSFMCIIFACLVIVAPSAAQKKDTLTKRQDSVQTVRMNDQLNVVQRISVERLADSLKKVELEKQYEGVSATDQEKLALIKELAAIKGRDSIRKIHQQQQIDSLRQFVKGYPVHPFVDTLFLIYTRQGSFLAKDRALAVNGRVVKLSEQYDFNVDSLKLVPSEQTTDLVYKDILVLSVSDQDALWAGVDRDKLAAQYQTAIIKSILVHQQETSWQTLLKQALLILLVIFVVSLLIVGINRLFKWIVRRTALEDAWYSRGIRIKNYELLNAARQLQAIHGVLTVVKWLVIILVIYLALPVLFGIFPFTRDISNALLGYILSPLKKIAHAVWDYIPNLITIIIVVIIFRYVLKFFSFIKDEVSSNRLTIPGFYPDWANPTYQIGRILILAFMLVVIFPYMPGSNSDIFKGVSVFIGVLFTFGSAGALSNVVAGLVLTYMRAFKNGDRVKIGDVTGDVIGRSLLVTRIRTVQNEVISIPNSNVMNNHTTNYSSEAPVNGLIMHTSVTIGYDVPWRQVQQLLMDAALATDMLENEPSPFVLQTSLDDYYVNYCLNAYTKEPNKQSRIYSALHANILDKFNAAGVEIMSPHYRAMRDGNETTVLKGEDAKD